LTLLIGLFLALWLFILSTRSIPTIFKFIFWITFINVFITHAIIQRHVFDLTGSGYATRIFWIADVLTYVIFLRMLKIKKYAKEIISVNIFSIAFVIIIISNMLNYQSIIYSILSTRMLYQYLFLAYIIYIYQFSDKEYSYYMRAFYYIALINSTFSILQFIFMDQLNLSPQMTGGVFGYHGTGIGAVYSVLASGIMFQRYQNSKSIGDVFRSIYFAIPIVTGYAYGGFILLILMILVLLVTSKKQLRIYEVIRVGVIGLSIIILTLYVAQKYQSEEDFNSYAAKFSNLRKFTDYTIKYSDNSSSSHGRLGAIIFAYDSISKNVSTILFGHGPGSLSYIGYTLGFGSSAFQKFGIIRTPSLFPSYLYETGFCGVIILIYAFISLYVKASQPKSKKGEYIPFYINYVPALVVVYFVGLFYTAVLSNYLLVFYFAIYIGSVHRNSKVNIKSNQIFSLNE
jgi:hypothetical protein